MSTREVSKVAKVRLSLHKDNDSKLNMINKVEQYILIVKNNIFNERTANKLASILDNMLSSLNFKRAH